MANLNHRTVVHKCFRIGILVIVFVVSLGLMVNVSNAGLNSSSKFSNQNNSSMFSNQNNSSGFGQSNGMQSGFGQSNNGMQSGFGQSNNKQSSDVQSDTSQDNTSQKGEKSSSDKKSKKKTRTSESSDKTTSTEHTSKSLKGKASSSAKSTASSNSGNASGGNQERKSGGSAKYIDKARNSTGGTSSGGNVLNKSSSSLKNTDTSVRNKSKTMVKASDKPAVKQDKSERVAKREKVSGKTERVVEAAVTKVGKTGKKESVYTASDVHHGRQSQQIKAAVVQKSTSKTRQEPVVLAKSTLKTRRGGLPVTSSTKRRMLVNPKASDNEYRELASNVEAEGWPVQGFQRLLLSSYGMRGGHYHRGVDIGVSRGTPVIATATGQVIFAGRDGSGYGNLMKVRHANGYETWYAHLDSFVARTGDIVTRDKVIARAGQTGNATTCHVHYEIHKDGVPVNPEPYLHIRSAKAPKTVRQEEILEGGM